MEEQDGERVPQMGQHNLSWGIPPRPNTEGCFGPKRWDAVLKRDTETSSGRTISCLPAMLKCISGDASARLLTAIHFVNSCGSARHYHPLLEGESALLSSIATRGFITLHSLVRLVLRGLSSPKGCAGAVPALPSRLCQWQHGIGGSSSTAPFQKGFLEQPQRHLHAWKNNISMQFPTDVTQTIHPLFVLKHITHYVERNQRRGAATF